jgi:hypothetical protein
MVTIPPMPVMLLITETILNYLKTSFSELFLTKFELLLNGTSV